MTEDRLFPDLLEKHRREWDQRENDPRYVNPKTLARTEHPDTSKEAAKDVVDKLPGSMAKALFALRGRPGSTASELDQLRSWGGEGSIRKRLNDLKLKGEARKGDKRKCRVTGKMAYTWYSTEEN